MAVGIATIDFGTNNQLATVAVPHASVAANSKIEASPYMLETSADHNEDEHLLMHSMTVFSVPVSTIVPGVSFEIRGFSDHLLNGRFNINWVGNF